MRTALPSHLIPSTHGEAVLRAAGHALHPAAPALDERPETSDGCGLLDALPHPALLLTVEGRILQANTAWREARKRRLIGGDARPGEDFLHACQESSRWPASGPTLANGLQELLAGKRERVDMSFGDGCRVYAARTVERGIPCLLVIQRQG